MTKIDERLANLRKVMTQEGISACIIPGTDPHASEYIADYWKEREWISGFDGSAGTAAVTLDKAGVWTDSRYFLQGASQLEATGFELMKQGFPDTLEIIPWLVSELKASEKVAVNSQMFSVNSYAAMKSELQSNGIQLVALDLIDKTWLDRPTLPLNKLFIFDVKYAGKSASEKIQSLRSELKKVRANAFIISAIDDIAWLFNIRGNDVSYNPVVISYAFVEEEKATLFIDYEKLTPETMAYLEAEGVSVAPYLAVYDTLKNIAPDKTILIDGIKLNQSLYESIPEACLKINKISPISFLKSIKNEVEIEGFRRAMISDGVALTRFFMWLEKNVGNEIITEISLSDKLLEFRSKQENFVGASFGTIAGYADHGAIVHYHATPESDASLAAENILLIDSGGQYLDGTTDITRTITLGKPTEQQISDFTLVLKGHINLGKAIFPTGTRGSQLDILARKAMWDSYLNYGHGTGHGIGHFLNVHEGPQSIRMEENPVTLQSGMVLSNEPGLYRVGEYGMRVENLILIVPAAKTEFGQFLTFETLTLFPIDKNLIDVYALEMDEVDWLDAYHQKVFDTLKPYLNNEEQKWLKEKCEVLYDKESF